MCKHIVVCKSVYGLLSMWYKPKQLSLNNLGLNKSDLSTILKLSHKLMKNPLKLEGIPCPLDNFRQKILMAPNLKSVSWST